MRFLAVALASVAVFVGASAHADSPPPAVDSVRLQLARELVETSGGEKTLKNVLETYSSSMTKILGQALPPDKAKIARLIQAKILQEYMNSLPQMLATTTQIYASNFNEAELQDYLAFMKSETGQSILNKMPIVLQQSIEAQGPFIRSLLPKITSTAIQSACEEANCTPAERQQVTEVFSKALKTPS